MFIPIVLLAAWGCFLVAHTVVSNSIVRRDFWFRFRGIDWVKTRKLGSIVVAFCISELTGFWIYGYVTDSYGWTTSFWRWSFAIEVALVVAAIVTASLNYGPSKWLPWRQNIILGAVCFVVTIICFPFIAAGAIRIIAAIIGRSAYDVAHNGAIGLGYWITAAVIAILCWSVGECIFLDQPIAIGIPGFVKAWWNRPKAEVNPSAPSETRPQDANFQPQPQPTQSTYQPQQTNVEKRPWHLPHFSMPGIPSILTGGTARETALIMCGRCGAAAVLIYIIAQDFGIVRDDMSGPTYGKESYFYGVVAAMVACAIGMFYFGHQAKGPFSGHLLFRQLGQLAIGFAVLAGVTKILHEGFRGEPYYRQIENGITFVGMWLIIAASIKFLRLPWLPKLWGRR
jgi:hypothetical protein